LAGLKLANPVMTASGTAGYATEYGDYMDLSGLGAFVTKSISLNPRTGNAPPRIVETRGGMLNAIGLANIGLERFVVDKLPDLARLGCPAIVNVAGSTVDEYVSVCKRLDPLQEVAGLEINVSCPNVSDGLTFGTDPKRLAALVASIRKAVKRSVLIVKLSPNVTDICQTAAAAADAGADALSLVNTFVGIAIDVDTQRPVLSNVTGGLSGPAIKPIALQMLRQVYRQVARDRQLPLIGLGGIQTWQDAAEFMLAGATAVGVGTGMFVDPTTPKKIVDGLDAYLKTRGLTSVKQIVGQLKDS
jgi:dihydroorotate dehydrogenase (NAD+) catalytic subunit